MFKYCLLFIFCTSFIVAQLQEGEECSNKRYNTSGTCILLEKCIVVLEDFSQRDLTPQICQHLSENQSVVCCPDVQPNVTTLETTAYPDSRTTCAKYAKSVFKLRESSTLGEPLVNISQFGFDLLVIGGEKARAGEFPHMALIGYDPQTIKSDESKIRWGCGGSLISEQWVVTAAHCLDDINLGPAKYVRLGELDYNMSNGENIVQDFTIIERVNKKLPSDGTGYDDIGLVKLNAIAKFDKYVRPACLWTEPEINANQGIASGWGRTKDDEAPSSHLLKVILNYVPHTKCNRFYQHVPNLPEGVRDDIQICFGDEHGKDTCQGDSGGPIQIYVNREFERMYYVLGVLSTGLSCTGISPGVYTRISSYVPWIEKIVWNSET